MRTDPALLESVRKRTSPEPWDLYESWCVVLYLKTGCQWRLPPNDFPRWQTVHCYFRQWSEPDQDYYRADVRLVEREPQDRYAVRYAVRS